MTNEELLKAISDMLKKHEDYLSDNPDVFLGIQDRLFKAIGYDDSETLEKAEDEKKKKPSKSGYQEWKPREDYSPEEQKKIDDLMGEGWSHREAERLAGAHKGPKDFQSALEHRVHPSQPSDKMLDIMKDLALQYKQRSSNLEGETADPGKNPQKYAAHKHQQAHEQAYGDYDKEYKNFLDKLDEQDLHPLEYDEAVSKWQKDWHEKHPEAKEQMIGSAEAGKHFDEAKEARDQRIKEGKMNLITGGLAGDESSMGEYSEDAGGGAANDFQTAAQMAGGTKGESGYEIGTVKDPAAIFREQNPDYVAELKRKMQAKLAQNPEMQERHAAMPHRERTPSLPKEQQPGKVKTFTPEEIKAMYGDKYKVKGDK